MGDAITSRRDISFRYWGLDGVTTSTLFHSTPPTPRLSSLLLATFLSATHHPSPPSTLPPPNALVPSLLLMAKRGPWRASSRDVTPVTSRHREASSSCGGRSSRRACVQIIALGTTGSRPAFLVNSMTGGRGEGVISAAHSPFHAIFTLP